MGGDFAPEAAVFGALRVAAEGLARVALVGDEKRIHALLASRSLPADAQARVDVAHAPQVVGMDESPSAALDRRDETSMGVAARLVKEKAAHAMVSAGSTGALMAISLFTVGRIRGIRRPAIAVLWPTRRDPVLVLDSGANADSRPEFLAQFAAMGSVYVEHALGRSRPRVGLLNIGGEVGKGSTLANAAYALLEKAPDLNFVGNVEPTTLLKGEVDVGVTDGFVGNMMLKTGEGVAEMILGMVKSGVASGLRAKIGGLLLKPILLGLKKQIDQSEYGGAPLLGLDGLVVKAHGRANETAVYNAVRVAVRAVKSGVVAHIAERLGRDKSVEGGERPAGATQL